MIWHPYLRFFSHSFEFRIKWIVPFSDQLQVNNSTPSLSTALQEYMGDIKTGKNLNEQERLKRAIELVDRGWKNAPQRDELFMQLIKQTTRNPKPYVINNLLQYCLFNRTVSWLINRSIKWSINQLIDWFANYSSPHFISRKSLELGWRLMAAYLYYFPPTVRFQSYLEGYLYKNIDLVPEVTRVITYFHNPAFSAYLQAYNIWLCGVSVYYFIFLTFLCF